MQFFYNLAIRLLQLGLWIKSMVDEKTKKWSVERKQHFNNLNSIKLRAGEKKIIWMHCASLGEYEQGIPVFKELKNRYPHHFYLVSFFSPSGYEQRKNTKEADEIIYLPIDTKSNANKIVETLNPYLFMGVKYEFWWNLLTVLQLKKCKIIFLSVYFEKEKYYLKYTYFKNILKNIDYIFTQDEGTNTLLLQSGFTNSMASLDTRVISVMERKEKENKLQNNSFLSSIRKPIIVYGSIYESDLPILKSTLLNEKYFHIVVPHKVDQIHIDQLGKELNCNNYWSKMNSINEGNIIIVDVIGILFDLYRYANLAYIGGGFEKGVHNTLEPAVYNIPVAFGPKNDGFLEVKDFMKMGIGLEVRDEKEFRRTINQFTINKDELFDSSSYYFSSKIKLYEALINKVKSCL